MPYNSDGIGHQDFGSGTSRQAADDLRLKVNTVRDKVLIYLRAVPGGATSEEIAGALGYDYGTIQPRTSELRREGKIIDSGIRKIGRHGKSVIVWIAV